MIKAIAVTLILMGLTSCSEYRQNVEEEQASESENEGSTQGDCIDGVDNDEDGLIDCQDQGCMAKPACESDSEEDDIDDLSWVSPSDLPAGQNPCREPLRLKVDYVVDGDTFFAQAVGDSEREKVRIIGINTPERDSQECYAEEATQFLRELIENKWVWLTFDGNCTDVFERTLAYVHLGPSESDFVERLLLQGGYAQAFSFDDTDSFEDLFAGDESQARANNTGGWGVCGW